MDISKLKRQFIREARSSPKKVAVLVLVMVVAAWRIVPLVSGAFSTGKDETSQVTVQTPGTSMPANNRQVAKDSSVARPSWREVAGQISRDPLMQSAELSAWRNPFSVHSAPALTSGAIEIAEEAESALSAKGLVLSSTAVGAQRRTALINGRMYSEGDPLDLTGATIVVVSIRPRSVLLESNGEQLELTIAQRPASQKIQIRREQSVARSEIGPEG